MGEAGSPLHSPLADLPPNAPPPRRCINFDDNGFVNDLPISPIKIIFDSDDSDVSDDSGVIVMKKMKTSVMMMMVMLMGVLTTIMQLIDHHHLPLLKDQGYFECTTHDVVYV